MGSYRPARNPDRIKAAAAVALVHVALAALIVSGLTVSTIVRKADALKVFDIREVEPPPAQPPPPPKPISAPKDEAAPPNVRSKPTEIVAPRVVSPPIPLPISAANVPGQGSDASAGASDRAGSGTGAGGEGSGRGGGGAGEGFTPARLLNKIPNADYRRITDRRMPRGSATITLRVNPDGSAADCRIARSSGDPAVDKIVCEIATRRLRFSPARDAQGRPIGQQIVYTPTWRPN